MTIRPCRGCGTASAAASGEPDCPVADVDDADLGMVGERRQGQQEALGLRKGGEGPIAARLHGLAGGREDRRRGEDYGPGWRVCWPASRSPIAAPRSTSSRSIATTFRLELHDGIDDARKIGARQRIAAAALHHGVVDRDDGDGDRADAARRGPGSANPSASLRDGRESADGPLACAAKMPAPHSTVRPSAARS